MRSGNSLSTGGKAFIMARSTPSMKGAPPLLLWSCQMFSGLFMEDTDGCGAGSLTSGQSAREYAQASDDGLVQLPL